MSPEMKDSILAREQQAYHDLVRYIRWLANIYAIRGHWMLNQDDLVAEGFFMLAKLAHKYIDKPYDEFLIIARTSIKNWFSTLKHKALMTHRKQDLRNYSLQAEYSFDQDDHVPGNSEFRFSDGINCFVQDAFSDNLMLEMVGPQKLLEHAEELTAKISKLTPLEKQVVNALLGNNERVAIYIDLQRKRRNWVYDNPTISVSPLVVARALCMDVELIKQAYEGISEIFVEDFQWEI